jgi:site-specific recombinase XerD
MGKLKDQMKKMMELRNFSRKTIQCYLMYMKEYVGYFKKSPELMGEEEILKYLCYLKDDKKSSWSGVNIAYSALKFFYECVLEHNRSNREQETSYCINDNILSWLKNKRDSTFKGE